MIITVTLNPAIDKTVEIEELKRGGLNRITRSIYDAGGKGINVSKTIDALGGTSAAVGFLAGNAGKNLVSMLEGYQIQCDFIWVDGETRTNTKVFEKDGRLTELNESGPEITKEQVEALLEKLDQYADENALFVLSGSIPASMDRSVYRTIIERVHKKGAKVLLDADGEAFRLAAEAAPDIVKPNIEELKAFINQARPGMNTEHDAESCIREGIRLLTDLGIGMVILSMGADGARFFWSGKEAVRYPALPVKIHSTVGAGDAMAAAWAYATERGMCLEEKAELAMAVSAGAVMTEGTKPPSKELVEQLLQQF